jgi:clan AA aspartic protease
MNLVHLRNPRNPALALEADALADSAALHVCIPQHVCDALSLEKVNEREVLLADGSKRIVPYVGPLEIRFKNRAGFLGALVMGDRVLVGAIAMEDLDLVIIATTRELDVNPRSPHIARTIATTVPGVSEPPGRYVLPRSSRGRRFSSWAHSLSARSPVRSRASPLP